MPEPLDVLLFHAHFLHADAVEGRVMRPYPPLGPRYVASWLKERGSTVGWFDSTFKREVSHFEIELSRHRPRVVGVHAHISARARAVEMIACARRFGATIIAGGPDATRNPSFYLENGVDIAVRGEGEITAGEVVSILRASAWRFRPERFERLPGISLRIGGRRVDNPDGPRVEDLDRLPWPLRPVEQMRAYHEEWRAAHGYTAAALCTSRGVPGAPGYRRRSPRRVVDELEFLKETFHPERVRVFDAVYTADPEWHRDCAEDLGARRLRLPFNCLGRPRDLTRDVVASLAAQGCYRVALDVPSGSRRILRRREAGFGVDDVYAAARHLREAGIALALFIHLGLPGETKDDVRATLEMVEVLDPAVFGVSVTDPLVAAAVPGMISLSDPDPGGRGPRYGAEFYRWALRLLTARMILRRGHSEGRGALSMWREAVSVPLYRTAFRVYLPRLPELLRRDGS
ncbi:B12-binding domain-containing radical SAM protein [Myxococcota bacterium]|nr:B12-binding domain-containing radical SAM protein [Myxococcota bacterium]